MAACRRAGFSLVELLVVLGIVGVLTALILPAIQAARAAARAAVCRSNLHRIGVAIHSHIDAFGAIPTNGRPRDGDNGQYRSFLAALLPYLDAKALDDAINFNTVIGGPENLSIRKTAVAVYLCPADAATATLHQDCSAASNAANAGTGIIWHGYNGIFIPYGLQTTVAPRNVIDGLANTCAVGEHLASDGSSSPRRRVVHEVFPNYNLSGDEELFRTACLVAPSGDPVFQSRGRAWQNPWAGSSWYNHFLNPNQPSCNNGREASSGAMTAGSLHSSLVHCLFADGSVRAVADSVDFAVWRAMGTRAGGERGDGAH